MRWMSIFGGGVWRGLDPLLKPAARKEARPHADPHSMSRTGEDRNESRPQTDCVSYLKRFPLDNNPWIIRKKCQVLRLSMWKRTWPLHILAQNRITYCGSPWSSAIMKSHIPLALYISRYQILPGPGRDAEKLAEIPEGTLGSLDLAIANQQLFQLDLPGTAEKDCLQLDQDYSSN